MTPLSIQFNKIMPQDLLAEETVLANCLSSNDLFYAAARYLQPFDFYNEKHITIFNAMVRLYVNSVKVDLLTVITNLRENNELQKIGGQEEIINLSSKYQGQTDLQYLCEKIKDCSLKRQAIKISHETIKKAFDDSTNGFELTSDTINAYEEIFNTSKGTTETTFAEEVRKSAAIIKNSKDDYGIKTGFTSLDHRIGSMLPQELIIIASGPGEGKSTFAFNIANHVAKTQGGVLFFTLEMSKHEMALKYLSTVTNQSVKDIRFNKFEALVNTAVADEDLDKTNIHIYDQGLESIHDIVSIAKSEKKIKNIKLIIIDYLQLIPGGNLKKFGTREQEISYVTRKLKLLATDIGLPVIALSQVSRQKGRQSYNLSDLRESGAIEQDANTVIFIWRPIAHNMSFYTPMSGFDEPADPNDAFIKIAKQRMGELDEWKIKFSGQASKFIDDHEDDPDSGKIITDLDNFTQIKYKPNDTKLSDNSALPF